MSKCKKLPVNVYLHRLAKEEKARLVLLSTMPKYDTKAKSEKDKDVKLKGKGVARAKKQEEKVPRLFVRTINTLHGRRHAVVDAHGVIQNYGARSVGIYAYNALGLMSAREAVLANNTSL